MPVDLDSTRRWYFGPFEVDAREQRVWRRGELVPITRKSFALLAALLERPATLITKAELFETVWAGSVVTDGALSRAIRELRIALGDDAAAPSYIETAHGLGFRFVAPVSAAPLAVPAAPAAWLVGRDAELRQLDAALAAARGGQRQLVFVAGEAGIGKTALVEAFVARHAGSELWAAQGRCIEQYGTREAYLPILEALERLAGQIGADTLRQTLERYAPAWLAQLPWLAQDGDAAALRRALAGTTARRMLRELAQALEVLAAQCPIVLWLEDLHWSDYSSLDVIAFLAGRRDAARLLVIGSYRPADTLAGDTRLRTLAQDLSLHGQGLQLTLQRLSVAAVGDYLRMRFDDSPRLPLPELAAFVHQRTEGNALFTVAVVDKLVRNGDLVHGTDGWHQRWPSAELGTDMPDSLRQLIHSQFERLGEDERRLLEAAAVAGTEFSAAAVAAALQTDGAEVEDRCARLVEAGRFLRSGVPVSWPDGSLTSVYGFLHALYWQALFDRVPPGRRADWQRRIALREEQAYGTQTLHMASELAMRFEAGRDIARSLHYLQQAAVGALARCAYLECVDLLRHGLGLVAELPEGQRTRQELVLLLPLGAALMAAQGYASDEVAASYQRALALCRLSAQAGELDRALRGLWNVALARGDLVQAQGLAEELLAHAEAGADTGQLFDAHAKLGQTCMHGGDFATARRHLEYALQLHAQADDRQALRESPRVAAYLAWVLWFTGHPDQARLRGDEALLLAGRAASAHSSAFALGFVSWLHLFCGDTVRALPLARQQIALSVEHGLPYWRVWGEFLQGQVVSRQGGPDDGLAAMAETIAAFGRMGARVGLAHFLGVYAEACLDAGRLAPAREALAAAADIMARHGKSYAAAEAMRLQGRLALAEGDTAAARAQAQAHFEQALAQARLQGLRALELRAAVSLARLWQGEGRGGQGLELLAPLCAAFNEGADTADLRGAGALLVELRDGVGPA